MDLLGALSLLGNVLLFINIVLLLTKYSKLSIMYKIFLLNLIVVFVIDSTTTILFENGINNLFLSHYYFGFQFIILSFYFVSLIGLEFFKKVNFSILFLVLIILGIQYSLNPSLYFKMNTFEILITVIPLICYSLFYFYKSMDQESDTLKYINIGLFVYLTSSFLVFATGDYILKFNKNLVAILWQFNALMIVVFQVLILWEWKQKYLIWKSK